VLVLLQRLGDFARAHPLWLLAEQVEQPLAGSVATDFCGVADHGPQVCGGIEVQGQLLLASDIAPVTKRNVSAFPRSRFKMSVPSTLRSCNRAGDLIQHVAGAGLAQVMHRQERDVMGAGYP